MEKTTRLFRSGGSVAVRIPKAWAPRTDRVRLRREGDAIVIQPEGTDLVELARKFARERPLKRQLSRPPQPTTPPARPL